jgi:ABC-type Zn uptake system ZnuABC Zn-binding protein ZnuA
MFLKGKEFTAAVAANEEFVVFETVSSKAAAEALAASVAAPVGYEWSIQNQSQPQEMVETWLVTLENSKAAERARLAAGLNGRS